MKIKFWYHLYLKYLKAQITQEKLKPLSENQE